MTFRSVFQNPVTYVTFYSLQKANNIDRAKYLIFCDQRYILCQLSPFLLTWSHNYMYVTITTLTSHIDNKNPLKNAAGRNSAFLRACEYTSIINDKIVLQLPLHYNYNYTTTIPLHQRCAIIQINRYIEILVIFCTLLYTTLNIQL